MHTFTFNKRLMSSGFSEAAKHTYTLLVGKSGKRWLHADTGDRIYVEGGPGSQGFGGSTLTFQLKDGSSLQLKGPWHTNSNAMFADTGVDLRAQHRTFTVVARRRKYSENLDTETMIDVVWRDEEPTYGTFERGKEKAQELADQYNETFVYTTYSEGGSSHYKVDPRNASKVR